LNLDASAANARSWLNAARRRSSNPPPVSTRIATTNSQLENAARQPQISGPPSIRSRQGAGGSVLPALGDRRLGDVRRADVQDLVVSLIGRGWPGSGPGAEPRSDRDRPDRRDRLARRVPHPGSRGRPPEATALPTVDRTLWATAMYGGLRAGGLRPLRVQAVDLDTDVIHVLAGWDDEEARSP